MWQHNVQRPVPDPAPDQCDYLTGIGDQVADALEAGQNPASYSWAQSAGGAQTDGAGGDQHGESANERISESANQRMSESMDDDQ
jgi:hypothetical protein